MVPFPSPIFLSYYMLYNYDNQGHKESYSSKILHEIVLLVRKLCGKILNGNREPAFQFKKKFRFRIHSL